jgi:hypothetical protein
MSEPREVFARRLRPLGGDLGQYGLAVSPAGTIFYTRHVSDSADLMLIENFR